jgi:signal transduction histidine kinase
VIAVDGKGISAEAFTVFPELAGPASAEWGVADFFAVAVHELRSPLTSIDGQAQLVQRFLTKDPARAAEATERIREQSKRMNRLIGDLLDQARVSVGALSLEVVTFDLGVAIAHTIGLHDHDDPPRITFAMPPATARVRGDPDRIAQILGNLLDNARKYSPPGSAIEVALAVVGNEAQVTVIDRGIGVPEDDRDRIFAPFYRTARTQDIEGTGLGLHISRRIAEQHHGRLCLSSTGCTGSTFVLALPMVPNEPHR